MLFIMLACKPSIKMKKQKEPSPLLPFAASRAGDIERNREEYKKWTMKNVT
jgi:hypothetical protein